MRRIVPLYVRTLPRKCLRSSDTSSMAARPQAHAMACARHGWPETMRRHYGRLCAGDWPMARLSPKEASPVGNPTPRDWIDPLWGEWLLASRSVERQADVMRKVSAPHHLVQVRKGLSRHAAGTVNLLTLPHPTIVFGLSRTHGFGALSLIELVAELVELARCLAGDDGGDRLLEIVCWCHVSYRTAPGRPRWW
jgi:hypothetical protein